MDRLRTPYLLAPVVLLALLLAAPGRALASNGAAPLSTSGRAAGRGGANVAFADDALSMALNPAGMLQSSARWRFDFQDMWVISRDRFRNDLNDESDMGIVWYIVSLGAIHDPGGADSDLRIGLSLTVPFGGGGETHVRSDIYPDGEEESLLFFDARFGPSIAWRPTPNVRIGAGVYYDFLWFEARTTASSTDGSSASGTVRRHRDPQGNPIVPPEPVLVEGQPITFGTLFNDAGTPDATAASVVELETAIAHGVSANFGIQWDVTDWLTVGVAYTSPGIFSPIKGKARVDAEQAIGAIANDPDIAAITGFLFDTFLPDGASGDFTATYDYTAKGYESPMNASIGVGLRPTDAISLGLDVRWINWSRAIDSLDVKLTGGDNANINEINGGDDVGATVKLDWKDVWVVAVGGSWAATDWLVLRLGYNYSSNPIRKNQNSPGRPTIEHHVTGGFTAYVTESIGLTFGLVYGFESRKENDEHPSSPQYSFTGFNQQQTFLYFGVSIDLW